MRLDIKYIINIICFLKTILLKINLLVINKKKNKAITKHVIWKIAVEKK
jgi:hypothetical protein